MKIDCASLSDYLDMHFGWKKHWTLNIYKRLKENQLAILKVFYSNWISKICKQSDYW